MKIGKEEEMIMQEKICIDNWLVTVPFIRGHGLISNPKSNNGSICRREMEMTTESPLDSRSNAKKIGLNICSDRTQDRKKSVYIFECI